MEDDFNSPQAVAAIFDFVKEVNKVLAESENHSSEFYKSVKDFLGRTASGVLGILSFDEQTESGDAALENSLIELLINLRNDAKLAKNYALSDKIRDELKELGIILQDSKEKTSYKKGKG
jgi:cysteinyl-tRNA synthetase